MNNALYKFIHHYPVSTDTTFKLQRCLSIRITIITIAILLVADSIAKQKTSLQRRIEIFDKSSTWKTNDIKNDNFEVNLKKFILKS